MGNFDVMIHIKMLHRNLGKSLKSSPKRYEVMGFERSLLAFNELSTYKSPCIKTTRGG